MLNWVHLGQRLPLETVSCGHRGGSGHLRRPGSVDANGDDIGVVILLMPHGGGVVPQQLQGEFTLGHNLRVVLLELSDSVLEVLFAAAADEFQIRHRAFA